MIFNKLYSKSGFLRDLAFKKLFLETPQLLNYVYNYALDLLDLPIDDSIRLLEAINQKGYYFRQFLLVNNGYPVKEFFQKNKAVRRAIALRQGKLVIVESKNKESLHDFAQALADIDISQAVYLIGGTESYGWYRTKPENVAITFGTKVKQKPSSTSYIIFQRE